MIPPAALRTLGTWKELPWEYPAGRVAPDAQAVKRFTWQAQAFSAITGEELKVAYYTENRVPVAKMEQLEFVARHEQQAIALLERVVTLATEGVAYLPMFLPFPFLHAAVCGAIQGWVEQGGYPDDWPEQIARALTLGNGQYSTQMQEARKLHATQETDPVLASFGWRIPIRPLEVSLVTLA